MPSAFNFSQSQIIDSDNRNMAASSSPGPMSAILNALWGAIDAGSIGIESNAVDVDSLALGGGAFSYLPSNSPTLVFSYGAGLINKGVSVLAVAAGTLTLAASTTNYVEVDPGTGEVSSNTAGFTSGRIQLYLAVTGVSAIATVAKVKALLASLANISGAQLSAAARTKEIEIFLGAVTATASFPIIAPGTACTVQSVSFLSTTGIATNATNSWAFGLVDTGVGGTNSVAILDTGTDNSTAGPGGSALVANVPRPLTLSSTMGNLNTTRNDGLVFTITATGAPTTIAGASLRIGFSFAA